MAMTARYAKGGPLGEVAAEAGEVGVPACCASAGGIEAEIADAGFCRQGDNKYIILTLYQYLYILTNAGALRGAGLQGGFEGEIGVAQVSEILHIE